RAGRLPFSESRRQLNDQADLYDRFDLDDPDSLADCRDTLIYRYFVQHGKSRVPDAPATRAEALHDNGVTQPLNRFIHGKPVVGLRGDHGLSRKGNALYEETAFLARDLARNGILVMSGGGAGAMEASHLGVLFRDKTDSELQAAVQRLAAVPPINFKK